MKELGFFLLLATGFHLLLLVSSLSRMDMIKTLDFLQLPYVILRRGTFLLNTNHY